MIRDVLYQEQGLTPSRHTASFAFPMSVIHKSMKPYQTKERCYINKGYEFLILQDAVRSDAPILVEDAGNQSIL